MPMRPVSIVSIAKKTPGTSRLCATVEAHTRNPRGLDTFWIFHVGANGIELALKCGNRTRFPYAVTLDQIPGNLADLTRTIAA